MENMVQDDGRASVRQP